ncbi:MAG: TlpA disulfide reductase family protein [Gemmatimonadota bacterium]
MRRQPAAVSHQPSAIRGVAACFLALALASVALAGSAMAQDAEVGLARGTVVRPVSIEDLDGQPVDLGQVIGRKPVLVEFWASWCTNCAALEPRRRAAYQRHGGRVEFLVVAVGVNQTRNSVRRHLAGHALPGRVLWDGNGAAVRAFQTPATSYVVVLDAQGRVTYTGIGPDQDLEAAIARVAR